jgi:hypothetical protein
MTIDKTDTDAPQPGMTASATRSSPAARDHKILVTNPTPNRADDVVVVDGTQGLEAASIQVSQAVTNGSADIGGCTVAAPQTRCSIGARMRAARCSYSEGQVVASAGRTSSPPR